jgi:trehalose/maltose hydrolase-like predicted phosphorylase
VSATPSLRQDPLLMFEQLREAAVKNHTRFDEAQQSIRTDEKLSKLSVSNAAVTQDVASSYVVLGSYGDASCSTLTFGIIFPLDMCLSSYNSIYTYSSVDKTVSVKIYDDSKCTGASTGSYTYAIVSGRCAEKVDVAVEYYKYSIISSVSALNTDGFLRT